MATQSRLHYHNSARSKNSTSRRLQAAIFSETLILFWNHLHNSLNGCRIVDTIFVLMFSAKYVTVGFSLPVPRCFISVWIIAFQPDLEESESLGPWRASRETRYGDWTILKYVLHIADAPPPSNSSFPKKSSQTRIWISSNFISSSHHDISR